MPALHERDHDPGGFEWTQPNDAEAGLLSYVRHSAQGASALVVCNFTPVPRDNVLAGVPVGGFWVERLNSDAVEYGGAGWGTWADVASRPLPNHAMPHTLTVRVPPLGCLIFEPR